MWQMAPEVQLPTRGLRVCTRTLLGVPALYVLSAGTIIQSCAVRATCVPAGCTGGVGRSHAVTCGDGCTCAMGVGAQPWAHLHARGAGPSTGAGAPIPHISVHSRSTSIREPAVGAGDERPAEGTAGDAAPHAGGPSPRAPPSICKLLSMLLGSPVAREVRSQWVQCGPLPTCRACRATTESWRLAAARAPRSAVASQSWLRAAGAVEMHRMTAANLDEAQERMRAMP